jgi:hypothetical protein
LGDSWKQRPKQEFIDRIITINGNPRQRGLEVLAWNIEREAILWMWTDKMIPRYVYDKYFIVS